MKVPGAARSLILFTASLSAAASHAEQVEPVSGNDIPSEFRPETEAFDHTRREEMIPMRDGVKLFTVILIPKHVREPMPIVLTRTRSRYASEGA